MRFREGLYKGEAEFSLETDRFDFDSLWKKISDVIRPDVVHKMQITSWTIGRSFEKDGLAVYFEGFYDDTPSRFTLKLLPFGGSHSEAEIRKLREMVAALDGFMG